MTKFVARWMDTKRPVPPVARKAAITKAAHVVRAAHISIKREKGDHTWGPALPRDEAIKRIRAITADMPVGELVRLRSVAKGREGRVFVIHAVDVAPPVEVPEDPAHPWAPILRELYRFVFDPKAPWAGQVHFAGAYSCRPNRRDPSEWSMHCDWPPVEAEDFGVDSLATGDEVNAAIKADPRFVYPNVVTVWREPLHYSHIHAQHGHNRTGTPRCAA